jgi:hypothetical protein
LFCGGKDTFILIKKHLLEKILKDFNRPIYQASLLDAFKVKSSLHLSPTYPIKK